MYKVFYHRRAKKQLQKLPKAEQKKVAKKIKQLQSNPLNQQLNIAPYIIKPKKSWRIRIGNLRAIYTFNSKSKIILIEYLGYRGNMYRRF